MARQKITLCDWQQVVVAAIFAACVVLSAMQGYAADSPPTPQSKEDKERIVKALLEGDAGGGFNRDPQLPPAFYGDTAPTSSAATPSTPVHVSAPVAAGEKRGLFEVTLKEAEKAVSQALVEQGAAEFVEAIILKPRSSVLYRSSTPITIQVATLTYEPHKHSWSANLLMTYEGQVVTAMPSSGRWQEMQQIPTLNRSMRIGEVIQETDITDDVYPMYRLPANSITAKADLIGKTPKRIISPSRPIRINEVQAPIILAKDATVTMRFHSAGMEISAVGITMEAGAKDQMIRVKNADSNTIVQAKVISASEVQIVDALASSTPQPQPAPLQPIAQPVSDIPPSPQAVMLAPEEEAVSPDNDTAPIVQQQPLAPQMPQQEQVQPQAQPQTQPIAQPPLQPSQAQLQPWQTQHQEHNHTQQQTQAQPTLMQPVSQQQQTTPQAQPPLPWQQQTQHPAPQAQTTPPPARTYGNPPKLKMAQPARSALQIGSPEIVPTDPHSEAASVLKELPSFSSSQPADSAASE